jgi:hypothetical protein
MREKRGGSEKKSKENNVNGPAGLVFRAKHPSYKHPNQMVTFENSNVTFCFNKNFQK